MDRITVTLFGSLAWTGLGHATDKAVILGLTGHKPETIDPDAAQDFIATVQATHQITLPDGRAILFDPARDIIFDKAESFSRHPNALRFTAFGKSGEVLTEGLWFSIGGGFIERDGAAEAPATSEIRQRVRISQHQNAARALRGLWLHDLQPRPGE